jgi:hypothetical protein
VTPDLRVRGLFLLPTFGTQFSETRVELFLFWLLSLDRGFETGRATQRGDLDLDQIIKSHDRFSCALLGELGVCIVETTMTTLKALTMTAALLAGGASMAMAQNGLPYSGYGYGYGYAAPLYDYAAPGYSYPATAPLYDYAAPRYVAPAQAGTTVIIVTPAPAYTAPPVSSGYYSYAPGYWGGYGRAGYWWR